MLPSEGVLVYFSRFWEEGGKKHNEQHKINNAIIIFHFSN
jgi:hypothetical protein